MRSNNVLGLIFSNSCESTLVELTNHRTTASVPIGGKYRMIDFTLSNMTNSGINNVGIIAKSGFMSLMDHIGSGKSWDFSKKHSGVTILPPYSGVSFANEIETLYQLRGYIQDATEEYILLTHSNVICNYNLNSLFGMHEYSNADITFLYKNMEVPKELQRPIVLEHDENYKVSKALIKPDVEGNCDLLIGTMIMKKDLFLNLITKAMSENELDLSRLIQKWVEEYNTYACRCHDYCAIISSIKEYFKFNMELMDGELRKELFNSERPIYTKVRDDAPSKYGLTSSVKHSLVSQGCVIDGEVENCVISKGVYVEKGAKVSNCIIMQDTVIGKNCNLNYVIIDKDVKINANKSLMGTDSYPIYIAKSSVID
jgi:glucose-1-phosphate adenylyltransferase